jgi:hypothetical protein
MTATAVQQSSHETHLAPAAVHQRSRSALICSGLVVALMLIESPLGLVVDNLYHEEPWAIAALRGNDLVTLLVVAPVLAFALVRRRTSNRWTLVWLGGLLYAFYNFAYYAFGTTFNDVFLLHVATMTLALVALIALVGQSDAEAMWARPAVRSDRWIALYMTLVGSALVAAWGGFSLRFAVTGELPQDVMPPTAVHLVYALDMSLLAPAFIGGGVLLWRRRPWGYALGVSVNLFGAAYLIVLEFVGGFQANAGIAGKTWISPPAILGASLCAACAVYLLRRTPDRSPSTTA